MANFNIAFERTLKFEGGFINDKDDPGGMTYKGVSRKNWPTSKIWVVVDAARTEDNFPVSLETNQKLQDLVRQFYLTNFWDTIKGDSIIDQDIANAVYDTAINLGCPKAIRMLQKSVNVFIQNPIAEDGRVGIVSLSVVNKASAEKLWLMFRAYRAQYYIDAVETNPVLTKYLKGWIVRAFS